MTAALTPAIEAGVELRELTELDDLHELADLLVRIWGAPEPLINADLLRALSKAGSYVAGAFVEGRMIGGCIGFHEEPAARTLHSHVAGVMPEYVGRRVGLALKHHQRDWSLARGITAIEWTYDPLVARNAHFNIAKLGARPMEYLTNFYGVMADAINGNDDSDRILVRWDLVSPPDPEGPAAGTDWVEVPVDIEAMRAADPAEARRWRVRVREALAPRMAAGWRVVGFERSRGYLLAPPAPDLGGER